MSRLHPFARLCLAALGLLLVVTVVSIVVVVGYVITQAGTPGQTPVQLTTRAQAWATANGLWITLASYPACVLWLGACRAYFDKRSFLSLGLRRPRLGSNLSRGLLAGFLAIAVVWAIQWLTGTISVSGFSAAARGPNVVFALLGWLLAFAAVGFFEEFLFRGYALHNLTNWLHWKWALIGQAVIFALVHLGNVFEARTDAVAALGAMLNIFLIGIFFALSYRKTGSLWFPIGFHAAWNFSLGCLFSSPVSGLKTFQLLDVQSNANSFLSGGTFGAEGSFLLLPVILALIWFMWQAPDHPQALFDLELVQPAPAQPPVTEPVAAPVLANGVAMEAEVEEDRENRYRTKFGTSAGFDETMLRELRELQQAREESEAQTRREREAGQTALQTELLKPTVVIEKAEPEIVEETVIVASEVAPVEAPQKAPVEEVAVAQQVAEEVAVGPKVEKPAAPVVEETPRPAPTPAPPKKARPKW